MHVGSKSLNRVVWLFAAVALASGLAVGLSVERPLASLGYTLGSALVIATVTGVVLLMESSPWDRRPRSHAIGILAGLLFILSGLVWIVPVQISTNEALQLRNATILLVTGGTLFSIFQEVSPRSKVPLATRQSWLAATLMSAVVALSLVSLYTQVGGDELNQVSMSWSLAGALVMLGLPLVLRTASRIAICDRARFGPSHAIRGIAGTCLIGIAFVLQGISLLRQPAAEALWWLPVLAIGLLLVSSSYAPGTDSGPDFDVRHEAFRGPVLAMLAIIACISAAGLAVLLGSEPAGADWGLVVVSGWVLVVSALIVCVSALRFQVNLSELRRRVSILARLSQTDPLTGVANRRGLDERLATEIQRAARFGHPLSIALIDVDDFKRVNDTYGHAAGDQVLQRIATLFVRELRTIDVIGRYGGEEFLIILPETDVSGAATAAARLISAVRTDEHHYLGRGWRITVSIGIAAFEQHGRTPAELLDAADSALYRAKQQGKDRVVIAAASP